MSEWIKCSDGGLIPDETPVLILLNGEVRIGQLLWEYPSFEDTYQAFRYWDCPYNEGQCWEHYDITHWMPLPEPPNA